MIQPLRRLHRVSFAVLTGMLPVVFVAGLSLRPPFVAPEPPSDRIHVVNANGTEMVLDARELWGNAVNEPDLMLYWSQQREGDLLPAGARLIGSLQTGRRGKLEIPRGSPARGSLVLYSLAHGKVVGHAPLPKEMP